MLTILLKMIEGFFFQGKVNEKVRWQPEYGTKVGQMNKVWRKQYEIITVKVSKEKKFWVSWFVILENTPRVYNLYIEGWVILIFTVIIRMFRLIMLNQLLIRTNRTSSVIRLPCNTFKNQKHSWTEYAMRPCICSNDRSWFR